MSPVRRLLLLLTGAIVLFLVAAIGIIVAAGRPMPFDAGKWREGSQRIRWRMARDTTTIRSQVIGLSPSKVEELLGKPNVVLDVNHPPPERIYFYKLARPLDPFTWSLRIGFENSLATNVLVSD